MATLASALPVFAFAQTKQREEGPLTKAAGVTEDAVRKTADATLSGTKAAGSGAAKAAKVTKDATVDGTEATATGTVLEKTGEGIGKVGGKVKKQAEDRLRQAHHGQAALVQGAFNVGQLHARRVVGHHQPVH